MISSSGISSFHSISSIPFLKLRTIIFYGNIFLLQRHNSCNNHHFTKQLCEIKKDLSARFSLVMKTEGSKKVEYQLVNQYTLVGHIITERQVAHLVKIQGYLLVFFILSTMKGPTTYLVAMLSI